MLSICVLNLYINTQRGNPIMSRFEENGDHGEHEKDQTQDAPGRSMDAISDKFAVRVMLSARVLRRMRGVRIPSWRPLGSDPD